MGTAMLFHVCSAICSVLRALLLHVLHMKCWYHTTTDLLLHLVSRQGYFLLMLCMCAALLYVTIDHGADNDCTDVMISRLTFLQHCNFQTRCVLAMAHAPGFLELFLYGRLYVCVCVCVCVHLKAINNWRDVVWYRPIWLVKCVLWLLYGSCS